MVKLVDLVEIPFIVLLGPLRAIRDRTAIHWVSLLLYLTCELCLLIIFTCLSSFCLVSHRVNNSGSAEKVPVKKVSFDDGYVRSDTLER